MILVAAMVMCKWEAVCAKVCWICWKSWSACATRRGRGGGGGGGGGGGRGGGMRQNEILGGREWARSARVFLPANRPLVALYPGSLTYRLCNRLALSFSNDLLGWLIGLAAHLGPDT